MAGRVVFFIERGSFEPAFQAMSLAITAVAMGDEVILVFAFDALRQLARGTYGKPDSERERAEAARAEGMGVLTPGKMLAEARALGAKTFACDTTVKLCGIKESETREILDEVLGLASLWRFTDGARTLTF